MWLHKALYQCGYTKRRLNQTTVCQQRFESFSLLVVALLCELWIQSNSFVLEVT